MSSLFDYNDLYRHDFPEQRALLRGVIAHADRPDEAGLRAAAEVALQAVERAIDLAQDRQAARAPNPQRHAPVELAREIDGLVRSVAGGLKFFAGQPAHPLQADAAALLRLALPRGLAAYMRSDRGERQLVAEHVADVLRQPGHAAVVELIGLTPVVGRLAALNPELATALLAGPPDTGDADAARRDAAELTRRVVHQVLGAFDPRDPAQITRRDTLLGELRAVQQRLRTRYAHAPATAMAAATCEPMTAQAK